MITPEQVRELKDWAYEQLDCPFDREHQKILSQVYFRAHNLHLSMVALNRYVRQTNEGELVALMERAAR